MKSKEEITEIKGRLAEAVVKKKILTQQRLVLKRIPFKTRSGEEHTLMLALIGLGSDQKEAVRVLQLAYALVRGRAYWTQERRTRGSAKPLALAVSAAAGVPAEAALAWIEAPVDDMARAAFATYEQAAREAAFAARAERLKQRAAAAE